MGVRIQELPETTGINKEDVLIVEDGQGTKKGTVQQLDEALGVSQLKEDLGKYHRVDEADLLPILPPRSYGDGGVVVTIGNNNIISLKGTSISGINIIFYNNDTSLPNWIVVGKKYKASISNVCEGVYFQIFVYDSTGKLITLASITNAEKEFTVPSDAVGAMVRVRMDKGFTVDESIVQSLVSVSTFVSLEEDIQDAKSSCSATILANKLINDIPKKKIITWIDDDTTNNITSVKTIADTLGIKACFGYIPSLTSETNLELLKTYQRAGHEIINHSYTHSGWYNGFTKEKMESDLILAIEDMNKNGFIDGSKYFVFPGDSYDNANALSVVRKWGDYGVKAGGGINTLYGEGRYLINRIFIDKNENQDSAYYTNIMDSADINEAPWIVIGTHSGFGAAHYDPQLVTTVLQYALDNGWEFMTLNEALKYRERFYTIKDMFNL